MSEQRDADLGARLDDLEVQEHGPEYWNALLAAAEPELERLRAGQEFGASPAASSRPRLAESLRGRRALWYAAAAAAAALAAFLLLAGLPGGNRATLIVGPAPATAAEAISYALSALDRYPGIEGAIVSRSVGADADESWSRKMSFVAKPDGSLRIESRNTEAGMAPRGVDETLVYDAPARAMRSLSDWSEIQPLHSTDSSGGQYYPRWWDEKSGMAAAEPDRELLDGGFPLWRVRAYLRTMLSDAEAQFITTEQDGRTVWVLGAEAVTTVYGSGDRPVPVALPVTITIDAATRLPLAFERAGVPGSYHGEILEFDIRPLSEAPAHELFTLQRPDDPGTHIEDGSDGFSLGGDQGFRELPFGDAAAVREATSGMAAFPQWVPRGFSLSSGTYRDDGTSTSYRPQPGAPELAVMNTFVSLCFRRGYDQAFVSVHVDPRLHSSTTRGTGEDKVRTDTSDPFVRNIDPEVAALWASHTYDVRLAGGGFAGATAHVVLEPETWPHLWVRRGPYVACIAGDLTKAQMVRMAESLESWNAPAGE